MTTLTHYRGPSTTDPTLVPEYYQRLDPNRTDFGYDSNLVAPADQIREVAKLTGRALWEGLINLDWIPSTRVYPQRIGMTSVDGDFLVIHK
jgi:hypothetical protein